MTLIAHLSDLHLGLTRYAARSATGQNQREADFQRAADAVAEHLIEQVKPDLVLVAGDTFDKFHIGTAAELGAVRCFQRLIAAGLEVVVVAGNHDAPNGDRTEVSLGHLRERGVDVHFAQGHRDVAGVRLHLVPYRTLSRFYSGSGELAEFDFSAELPNVLISHGYAPGEGVPVLPKPDPVQIPAEWLTDQRFALTCLGHVHVCERIAPRVFYGGVLERPTFDDVTVQPAFWLHTITDGALSNSEKVLVSDLGVEGVPRPMQVIEIDASELTLDELAAKVQARILPLAAAGAIVTLRLLDVSSEFGRRRLRRDWERMFKDHGGLELDIEARPRRVTELLDVRFASAPKSIPVAFEEFVNAQTFAADSDRAAMLELGLEVLAVAHDQIAREAVK